MEATLGGEASEGGWLMDVAWRSAPRSCKIIKNLFYFVPVTIVFY